MGTGSALYTDARYGRCLMSFNMESTFTCANCGRDGNLYTLEESVRSCGAGYGEWYCIDREKCTKRDPVPIQNGTQTNVLNHAPKLERLTDRIVQVWEVTGSNGNTHIVRAELGVAISCTCAIAISGQICEHKRLHREMVEGVYNA